MKIRYDVLVASIVAMAANTGAAQVTQRVSVYSNGMEAAEGGVVPSISADGRCVLFHSSDPGYVRGGTNGFAHVFVHDRYTGTTTCVSVDSNGVLGNANSY